MVGDADLDAAREKVFDLVRAGYAAIDGHDEVRMACHATLDRGLRQGVSLIVAMRDEPVRIGAERPQGTHRESRGRNAVNVEVAKDEDALLALDGGPQAIDDIEHAGDRGRIHPIALERGGQERTCGIRGFDTTRDEDPREKGAEIACQGNLVRSLLVNGGDIQSGMFAIIVHIRIVA